MPVPKVFFDTNILLYLLSSDTDKADRAEVIMLTGGLINVQVLNEMTNVARRKLAMTWVEINEVLTLVCSVCRVESLTIEVHNRGRIISERYNLSVYDSMIIAAALLAGCKILYSEDMQNGQLIDQQLTICNPFVSKTHP